VEPEPPIIGDAGGTPTAVLRLTVKGTMNSQAVYWYWDFLQSVANQAPADPAVPTAAVTALVAAYAQNVVDPLLNNLSVLYTANAIGVTQVSSRTAMAVDYTPAGWPKPGIVSGQAMPQNVACVLTKYSQFRGRRGRGRLFMGGIPISAVGAGVFTPAFLNAIGPVFQLVIGGFVVAPLSWFPCITRGHTKQLVIGPPPIYEVGVRGNQCTSFKIHSDTRTQRRRNIGRGI
jgi:hypothetical protein